MINVLEKVILGEIEQVVLARGNNEEDPIILFLHGGPGLPFMPFHQYFQEKIEKNYIVVHWDQRGAGKSYSENISPSTMSLEQIINDAEELVELLKKKFAKKKIYLVGHSFGSIVGMHLASRKPENFYAYVGIGQVVNFSEGEEILYKFALDNAIERNDEKAIDKLSKIKNPPFCDEEVDIVLKYVRNYGGSLHKDLSFSQIAKECKEYSLEDFKNIPKGLDFSDRYLWKEVVQTKISEQYTEFQIPIYFFCGAHDYLTPTSLIEEYFNIINSPKKKLVLFEDSAHFPFIEEPEKFAKEIINLKCEA